MFWVISVYFNVRDILPKSGTFPLGHLYIGGMVARYQVGSPASDFGSLFLTLLAPSLVVQNQHTVLQGWTSCVTISEFENYGPWDVTPLVL